MDVMLVFWALSAALVLGVMMLFVVMIARGMDKPIAPKAEASEQLAKVMASLGAKPEAGSAPSETASSGKSVSIAALIRASSLRCHFETGREYRE